MKLRYAVLLTALVPLLALASAASAQSPDGCQEMVRSNGACLVGSAPLRGAVRGHEDAWQRDDVAALIRATLDQVPGVLWRMKRDAEPTAIAFVRDNDTGEVSRSAEFPATADFGEEGSRLMRAQQLLRGRT